MMYQADENRTLWVGSLQYWMDENYLFNAFASTIGEVVSVKVIRNKQTNLSEGYGFVEFANHFAAERTLTTYNGALMPQTQQTFMLNWAVRGAGNFWQWQVYSQDYPIFVGDLSADVTDDMLQDAFRAHYSSVKGAKVITDHTTGWSKGYGFVRFGDEGEQQRAMTEMNGIMLATRPMRIGLAVNKTPASLLKKASCDGYDAYGHPQGYDATAVQDPNMCYANYWGCGSYQQNQEAQWNAAYYGYYQGYTANGYAAAAPQLPDMYYPNYAKHWNYQQTQQGNLETQVKECNMTANTGGNHAEGSHQQNGVIIVNIEAQSGEQPLAGPDMEKLCSAVVTRGEETQVKESYVVAGGNHSETSHPQNSSLIDNETPSIKKEPPAGLYLENICSVVVTHGERETQVTKSNVIADCGCKHSERNPHNGSLIENEAPSVKEPPPGSHLEKIFSAAVIQSEQETQVEERIILADSGGTHSQRSHPLNGLLIDYEGPTIKKEPSTGPCMEELYSGVVMQGEQETRVREGNMIVDGGGNHSERSQPQNGLLIDYEGPTIKKEPSTGPYMEELYSGVVTQGEQETRVILADSGGAHSESSHPQNGLLIDYEGPTIKKEPSTGPYMEELYSGVVMHGEQETRVKEGNVIADGGGNHSERSEPQNGLPADYEGPSIKKEPVTGPYLETSSALMQGEQETQVKEGKMIAESGGNHLERGHLKNGSTLDNEAFKEPLAGQGEQGQAAQDMAKQANDSLGNFVVLNVNDGETNNFDSFFARISGLEARVCRSERAVSLIKAARLGSKVALT